MKWTDDELEPVRPRGRVQTMIDELHTQPGRWAEIDRYPPSRAKSAYTRGSTTCKRYPELEYAVRTEDDGTTVLYFRVAPGGGAS